MDSFAAKICFFVIALKRVDFPTLGSPTIPAFNDIQNPPNYNTVAPLIPNGRPNNIP